MIRSIGRASTDVLCHGFVSSYSGVFSAPDALTTAGQGPSMITIKSCLCSYARCIFTITIV